MQLPQGFASPPPPPWRHHVPLTLPPQEANNEKQYSSTKQKKADIAILNLFFGQFTQASPTKFKPTISTTTCLLRAWRAPGPAGGRVRGPQGRAVAGDGQSGPHCPVTRMPSAGIRHGAESTDMAHGPARGPGAGREGAGPRGWTGVRAGLAASWTPSSALSRGRREPRAL